MVEGSWLGLCGTVVETKQAVAAAAVEWRGLRELQWRVFVGCLQG